MLSRRLRLTSEAPPAKAGGASPIGKDVSIPTLAEAHSFAGYLSIYAGDLERGDAFLEKSLTLYRDLGDKSGIAWQLVWLGWVSVAQGCLYRARTFAQHALVMQQALGDQLGASVALVALGEAEFLQANFAQAEAVFEESLGLVRDLGNLFTVGRRLTRLGQIACAQAALQRATALTKEGLVTCADSGDKSGATMALVALAGIAEACGNFERAARLLGSVEALREMSGTVIWFVDRIEYERNFATIHEKLAPATLQKIWKEGLGLTLEQAIEYALSEPETPVKPSGGLSAQEAKMRFGGLTARERQAAGWIAQGKSNREIAELMVVRVKTVETYVTRILNKLGYDSRVQIAIWAVEKGLAPPLTSVDD